ncbi:hypothetical protein [Pseudoalteromonas phage PH357]|nr:hypothetical protein [Pseudoalteromonas phage PH357]
MGTIPDITIPSDDFISINTQSGLAVGTAIEIQLKGVSPVVIYEGSVKPLATVSDGKAVTNLKTGYAVIYVTGGSEEIWARCLIEGRTSKINVSEA